MPNGKSTAVTRRPTKDQPVYKELEAKFQRQGIRLRNMSTELAALEEPDVIGSVADFAVIQTGAAVVGMSKAAFGPEPMGVPIEIWEGLPTFVLGALLQSPRTVRMSGGMFAPFTAEYFEDMGKDLFAPAEPAEE